MSGGLDDLIEADADVGETRRRSQLGSDRRGIDRRRGVRGRRTDDQRLDLASRTLARLSTALSITASVFAAFAFVRAPVAYSGSPECPSDGFNGQVQASRGLSTLWIVVMVLCAVAVALPNSRRRPIATMLFTGLCVGLLAGALLRLDTWLIGYCFS